MARIRGIAILFKFTNDGYPAVAEDVELLADSIEAILKTMPGDRVHRPTFGCYLKRLLFTNMSRVAALRAQTEARRAIQQWEPRVIVDEVVVKPVDSKIELTVIWRPKGDQERRSHQTILSFGE